MADRSDKRKVPPWLQGKKKKGHGDVDQDSKAAKHKEPEEGNPDETDDHDYDDYDDDDQGQNEQMSKPKPSGPSIGKQFGTKTTVFSKGGDGSSAAPGKPGSRTDNFKSRITGKAHPAVGAFFATATKMIQSNFPGDADRQAVCGKISARWFGGN